MVQHMLYQFILIMSEAGQLSKPIFPKVSVSLYFDLTPLVIHRTFAQKKKNLNKTHKLQSRAGFVFSVH